MYHLITHYRVVCALMIREMASRYGKKPGGYIWAIVDPASHIVFLTVIFMAITRSPALGTSFPLFFATGYIGFQFYQSSVTFLNKAVKSNRSLLSYPNVAPIDTLVARYLLQLGTTSFVAILVLSAVIYIEDLHININWAPILVAILGASLLALGHGFLNSILFVRFPIYEHLFSIVSRPVFLVSGVFFLPDAIPHPFREWVLLNPLVHVIMLFRQGFYPQYRATGLDVDYLLVMAAGMLFLGMVVFTFSRATLRQR